MLRQVSHHETLRDPVRAAGQSLAATRGAGNHTATTAPPRALETKMASMAATLLIISACLMG